MPFTVTYVSDFFPIRKSPEDDIEESSLDFAEINRYVSLTCRSHDLVELTFPKSFSEIISTPSDPLERVWKEKPEYVEVYAWQVHEASEGHRLDILMKEPTPVVCQSVSASHDKTSPTHRFRYWKGIELPKYLVADIIHSFLVIWA